MTSTLPHEPLSHAQLDRLQQLLESSGSGRLMNMERLDGFLAALVTGPDMVLPSEYLTLVWGSDSEDDSAFAREEEMREFLSLLMHQWNAIAGTLESGDVYVPILLEDEKGVAHGLEWAKGFMQGVNLGRGSWAELIADEEAAGAILPMALMAGEVDLEWPHEPLTDEKREEILTLMTVGLVRIHRYFKPHRKELARADRDQRTYRRAIPKVGRNDHVPAEAAGSTNIVALETIPRRCTDRATALPARNAT